MGRGESGRLAVSSGQNPRERRCICAVVHRAVVVRMIRLIPLTIVYQCLSINYPHHRYNATITSSAVDKRAGSNETARPTAALVAL